jgi:hypothetical protein
LKFSLRISGWREPPAAWLSSWPLATLQMNDELHQQVVEQCAKLVQEDHIEHEDIIRSLQIARDA